jgi:hypothetical protein
VTQSWLIDDCLLTSRIDGEMTGMVVFLAEAANTRVWLASSEQDDKLVAAALSVAIQEERRTNGLTLRMVGVK